MLCYVLKEAKYEKQKPVSRRLKGSNDSIYSQLGQCFELFTLRIVSRVPSTNYALREQLVFAQCRERVYFEEEILALLLVCQTHN